MSPIAAPDQINPGIEDVIADAERHKHGSDPIADHTRRAPPRARD
jgi:NADH-quinone oxidoreductase subunit D